jgi:hypothetical protein
MGLGFGLGLPFRRTAVATAAVWSPDTAWFSAGEQGVWYDPTDLTRYTTDALGPELVTNGTFDTDTSGWAPVGAGVTLSVSSTALRIDTTSANGLASQSVPTVAGLTYRVSYLFLGTTSTGNTTVLAGAAAGPSYNNTTAAGVYSFTFVATSSSTSIQPRVSGGAANYALFDNISVRELTAINSATMYQDSTGTTPVTAVEQPVGLILDRRLGALGALGSNVIDFPTLTPTAEWSYSGSAWVLTGSTTNSQTINTTSLVVGKWYRASVTVSAINTGSLTFRHPNSSTSFGPTISAPGTYTAIFQATGTALFLRNSTTGQNATVTAFSAQEVPGNHAFQATSTARPTLRNRYNLLTFSEQFDNGAWGRTNIQGVTPNAIAAPDGTTTADLVIPNTTSGAHLITNTTVAGAAGAHALKIRVKPGGYSKFALRDQSYGTVDAVFHLSGAGSVMWVTGATASASIEAIEDGWYLITATSTLTDASSYRFFILPDAYTSGTLNSYSWSGDGTSGVYMWGASLTTAADASLPYQRIAAATDYDSDASKFPLYLACDGSDDSLATGSINFTGTDKMTVVAGLLHNNVSATGVFLELSADAGSNAGTIAVYANVSSYSWRSGGSTRQTASPSAAPPVKNVFTGIGDISGDLAVARLNGAVASTNNADQGTGNYGNYQLFIGRRAGSSLSFNGRIHQLIIRGAASTDIAQAESFVAARTGVTL